jgi:hypothetical protein
VFTQMIIDQRIPHTNLCKYIIIVGLTIICESESEFDQLQLIVESFDQFNVFDVIFDEELIVVSIERV